MNIAFRTDASYKIGSGHVMRCLTLADELKKQGHNVIFICRDLEGNLFNQIQKHKISFVSLPQTQLSNNDDLYHSQWLEAPWDVDAKQTSDIIINFKIDFLIVDHYAMDYKWEEKLRKVVKKIMVIDDLADRKHHCSILLDQNYYYNMYERYNDKLKSGTIQLIGPKYSLIRDEFTGKPHGSNKMKDGHRILVFFGGTDPTNETFKTLKVLSGLKDKIQEVHVVVGINNQKRKEIEQICLEESKFTFHCQIDYMAKLMQSCTFAICAAGSTTWERYCSGLPGIVIAVAHNQIEICETLVNLGIDEFLGHTGQANEKDLIEKIEKFIVNHIDLVVRRQKAIKIVDGLGKKRIVDIIEKN